MNFPTISIVVPSYNQGRYLEETLRSIIDQQYPALELLVADGGSTDNSVDIIKKYENHISWWVSEKDSGQSDAINKGFSKATGEVINWICSDDKLAPGALFTVAELFNSSPGSTGVVYGNIDYINEKSVVLKNPFDDVKNRVRSRIDFFKGMAFAQPAAFFRRSLLEQTGYLDTGLHYGMDYDLFAKLALITDFRHTKELIAYYRLHTESKSVKQKKDFSHDWLQICGRVYITLFETEFKDLVLALHREGFDYGLVYSPYRFSFDRGRINDVDAKEMCREFLYLLFEYQLAFEKFEDAYRLLKYTRKQMPALFAEVKQFGKHYNRFRLLGVSGYRRLKKWKEK